MSAQYTIGLDYGTNSVRALIVNVANGAEIASAVWEYAHGTHGVILSRDPNLARQHPADYVKGAEVTIKSALASAKRSVRGFKPEQVIGIGVDTTGSTPLPVDANGQPLAFHKKFANNPAAMAWLWKDHTGVAEAARNHGTRKKECARNISPSAAALIRANGFGARFCIACAPRRRFSTPRIRGSNCADFVPAALTGTEAPEQIHRRAFAPPATRRCGMLNWGGYPDAEFLSQAGSTSWARCASGLTPRVETVDQAVGGLTEQWAKRTGLTRGNSGRGGRV